MGYISSVVMKHIIEYDKAKTGNISGRKTPPPPNIFNLSEIYAIGRGIVSEIEGHLSDTVINPLNAEKGEKCPECNGIGHTISREPKSCPKCRGTGKVEKKIDISVVEKILNDKDAEKVERCRCKPDKRGQKPSTPEGICPKCNKPHEIGKPSAECQHEASRHLVCMKCGQLVDDEYEVKSSEDKDGECPEHIWGIDTSETVRKGQVFCLNCGMAKPSAELEDVNDIQTQHIYDSAYGTPSASGMGEVSEIIEFLSDRLIHRYGENPNVDYLIKAHAIAERIR